jgi:hypothetical protein
MEESKDIGKGLTCPFCGAPQREVVPTSVAQVKCKYCGSIIPISPHLKGVVPRCPNHPEAFATGLCNDCGEHFCTQCLQSYDLKTQSDEARLFLCPDCLRKRELEKANAWILVGFLFVAFGFFVTLMNFMMGILLILSTSLPMIVYGIYKRGSILTKEEPENPEKATALTKETEVPELAEHIDADALYAKMLSKYAMRWGIVNAKELLDNEISAYVRDGLSYGEAVRRVAHAKGLLTAESMSRTDEIETEKKRNKNRHVNQE